MVSDHEHKAVFSEHSPNYRPNHFMDWCSCGKYRYRVAGGPWTEWIVWDESDDPNPALKQ